MKTRLHLDMRHRTSTEHVWLVKEFDGAVVPPFRHQELNFGIQIEYGDGALDVDVQSVTWLPEEGVINIRTAYIYYDSVEEMNAEVDILRSMGWK